MRAPPLEVPSRNPLQIYSGLETLGLPLYEQALPWFLPLQSTSLLKGAMMHDYLAFPASRKVRRVGILDPWGSQTPR